MNSLEAYIRNTKTKGELNELRKKGNVPAILYGGKEDNQKISLTKKHDFNIFTVDEARRMRGNINMFVLYRKLNSAFFNFLVI